MQQQRCLYCIILNTVWCHSSYFTAEFIRVMLRWVCGGREQQHWFLLVTVQKEMLLLQQECIGTVVGWEHEGKIQELLRFIFGVFFAEATSPRVDAVEGGKLPAGWAQPALLGSLMALPRACTVSKPRTWQRNTHLCIHPHSPGSSKHPSLGFCRDCRCFHSSQWDFCHGSQWERLECSRS